jgi:uncharacterized membrane protein
MDKKYLLIISMIAIVIVLYLVFIMNNQYIHPTQCNCNETAPRLERERGILPILPPMPILFIVGIIFFLLLPLIFFYSNMQVEKKLSASTELLSKLIDKHNGGKRARHEPSVGRELVAKLLEPREMAVVDRLIEQPRGIQQGDIVKMPGMTKLKAHRMVERLRQKGIITVQKDGKTNLIKLDSRTRSLLSGLE